jgi:hypothetical protein
MATPVKTEYQPRLITPLDISAAAILPASLMTGGYSEAVMKVLNTAPSVTCLPSRPPKKKHLTVVEA